MPKVYHKICRYCKYNFIVIARNHTRIFCSAKCSQVSRVTTEPRMTNCIVCSKALSKCQRKFCTKSCSAKHRNKTVVRRNRLSKCIRCGNGVKSVGRLFCSNLCYRTNQIEHGSTAAQKQERIRITRNECAANYRARLRTQTPNNVDRKAIRGFYLRCPTGYEVDHIIPISKGGPHSLDNLQYLSVSENRRKSNKLEVGRGREI